MYKVVDFFCGGGGFSEGFKLAGFEIIVAIDKWQPAVTTHHANHPNADTRQDDVIRISNLPDEEFHELVLDSEVIIGSPPCTFFSNSNKSGKADKSLGVELIESYLRIVARKYIKKDSILKHWVLENVPNVFDYIKDKYTYKELGIDKEGTFQVKYPSSRVYNAKYFNVASNRKRYFCGNFPEPEEIIKDDSDVRTINNILSYIKEPNENLEEMIQDPNYDFKMKSKDIMDHHYIMEIADFEWKKAQRQKQDKGYMGRMSFPENFDKPSRTVMATMSCSSRESMIYPFIPDEERYRLPTVREIACLMSYPLDYRFYGKSKSIKYKLVGNSVPPKMSFAIAKAIAIAITNNLELPNKYQPIEFDDTKEDFKNLNGDIFHINIEKEKRPTAKFKYHIPYLIVNTFRVELTNKYSNFDNLNFKWNAEIHKSQGKTARTHVPKVDLNIINKEHKEVVKTFIKELQKKIYNANNFQNIYCQTDLKRKEENLFGPYELLDSIKFFIENNIDKKYYKENIHIKNENIEIPYIILMGYYILKESKKKFNKK
ncbi:DNA cytosine methyltransferase [Sulfurimonas sp. CS5]|uniref:DNA cytosine methyltransferase n=1 Tax=Sulfurimonas sp. CS5 TaxID=3391145 RepID=UPI0039E7EFCF